MLIRLIIAWFVGTVAAHLLGPPLAWLLMAAGGVAILLVATRERPRLRTGAWLALAVLVGAIRYSATLPTLGPSHVAGMLEHGELRLVGLVAEEPRHTTSGQRLVLSVTTVQVGGVRRAAEGRVLVVLPPYPTYHYGQRLLVAGVPSQPRAPERKGDFDYRAYLAHRNIFVIMQEPDEVRLLAEEGGFAPLAALLAFRQHCSRLLLRLLPEPQAALAVGITLGIRSGLPDEVANAFATTGTSHILVISGWHFSLVTGVLTVLALHLRLSRLPTLGLNLAVMWSYALFAGASAAVLRAAAMSSLTAIGRASGREREPWRMLGTSCWLLCLANPHTLWDVGFQLSALAIASLFAFSNPVEQWLNGWRPLQWPLLAPVRATLTATFAVQVLTLPLLCYYFGNLSLVAPLANVVLVPALPFAMAASALTLVGALLWLPLGHLLAPLAWLPLLWMSEGVRWLSLPRWAALSIPPFPLWVLLAYYALILVLWELRRAQTKFQRR